MSDMRSRRLKAGGEIGAAPNLVEVHAVPSRGQRMLGKFEPDQDAMRRLSEGRLADLTSILTDDPRGPWRGGRIGARPTCAGAQNDCENKG